MKNNTKKSINIGKINIPLNYWTGLAVYAVILLILAICMIAYTGSCLKKYENSQSDKVMNDFLNDFTKMLLIRHWLIILSFQPAVNLREKIHLSICTCPN